MELEEDGLDTTRIRLGALLGKQARSAELPSPRPTPNEAVSVTQAIRVRRSTRRRRRFAPSAVQPPNVSPRADASFPAVVTLLLTTPVAWDWASAGAYGGAIALPLGVGLVAYAAAYAFSRTLDEPTDS